MLSIQNAVKPTFMFWEDSRVRFGDWRGGSEYTSVLDPIIKRFSRTTHLHRQKGRLYLKGILWANTLRSVLDIVLGGHVPVLEDCFNKKKLYQARMGIL